jgi:hypothetical protein
MGNITELERNSKIKSMTDLYTGINGLKNVYQPKTTLLEDKTVTCLHPPVLNRWVNHFCQLLTAETQYLSLMSLKSRWLLQTTNEPHARLPWHLALYIKVCSSHLKTPVIALLGCDISRKHTADFALCEGYQTVHSPEIGWQHELMVMWLSRQDLRVMRLFWGNKTPSNVRNGLTLGSDVLENTCSVMAVLLCKT